MVNETDYCVDAQRRPIVGVITRHTPDSSGGEIEFLPVYLDDYHSRENCEFSGGLRVYCPGYQNHIGFKVVWCVWPETEDDARLKSVEDEVRALGEKLLDNWSNGDTQVRRRYASGFGDISFPKEQPRRAQIPKRKNRKAG